MGDEVGEVVSGLLLVFHGAVVAAEVETARYTACGGDVAEEFSSALSAGHLRRLVCDV